MLEDLIIPPLTPNPPLIDKNHLDGLPDGWYEDNTGPQYIYVYTDVANPPVYAGIGSAWVIQKSDVNPDWTVKSEVS